MPELADVTAGSLGMVSDAPACAQQTLAVEGWLFCVDCGLSTGVFERDWRGFHTDDAYGPPEVAILCPECADRQFGPPRDAYDRPDGADLDP